MVEVINSSFIPKNEFKKKSNKKSGLQLNIFFLISLVLFLVSVISSIGIYLWKQNLEELNNKAATSFAERREDFAIESIEEYIKISKKIKAARELLENHYDILPVFAYLENNTLNDVVLTNFAISEIGESLEVSASGQAQALTDLQLQSRAYAKNKNISDLILSNITKSKEGYSVFDLSFSVKKKYLTDRIFNLK